MHQLVSVLGKPLIAALLLNWSCHIYACMYVMIYDWYSQRICWQQTAVDVVSLSSLNSFSFFRRRSLFNVLWAPIRHVAIVAFFQSWMTSFVNKPSLNQWRASRVLSNDQNKFIPGGRLSSDRPFAVRDTSQSAFNPVNSCWCSLHLWWVTGSLQITSPALLPQVQKKCDGCHSRKS